METDGRHAATARKGGPDGAADGDGPADWRGGEDEEWTVEWGRKGEGAARPRRGAGAGLLMR